MNSFCRTLPNKLIDESNEKYEKSKIIREIYGLYFT